MLRKLFHPDTELELQQKLTELNKKLIAVRDENKHSMSTLNTNLSALNDLLVNLLNIIAKKVKKISEQSTYLPGVIQTLRGYEKDEIFYRDWAEQKEKEISKLTKDGAKVTEIAEQMGQLGTLIIDLKINSGITLASLAKKAVELSDKRFKEIAKLKDINHLVNMIANCRTEEIFKLPAKDMDSTGSIKGSLKLIGDVERLCNQTVNALSKEGYKAEKEEEKKPEKQC